MKRILAAVPLIIALASFVWAEEPAINVFTPLDETITTSPEVELLGEVARSGRYLLELNGQELPLFSNGQFQSLLKLKVGKNTVKLRLLDNWREVKAEQDVRILRLQTFNDLDQDYWSKRPVEYFATLGLARGTDSQTFAPTDDITRAQLTELIANLAPEKTAAANQPRFSDVPAGYWAGPAIRDAAAKGLVNGYPDGTFRPDNTIIRVEALAVILRFTGLPLTKEGTPPYADIAPGFWGEAIVATAKRAGFLDYIKTDIFGPEDTISRGEVIALLAATKYGKAKIRELLDFTKGY